MATPIPGIEVSDDGNSARIWSPDGKPNTGDAVQSDRVRAQHFRKFEMAPFVKKMKINIAEYHSERVRVFSFLNRAWPVNPQKVWRLIFEKAFEKVAVVAPFKRANQTVI
jgi:hypothetical protein